MLSYRTATLMGSTVLFIAVSLLLVRDPALAPGLFPFYGAIILWSDLRREAEIPVIFLFLVSTAGLLLASQLPPGARAALSGEVGGVWLLTWTLSRVRERAARDARTLSVERQELESRIRDDERDLAYYKSYSESVGGETRLRREISESAKSLGAAMEPQEVQRRLVSILNSRFPGAEVSLAAAAEGDALLELALRRKGPVLVRDCAAEPRLHQSGSAVAVPMKVMGQPAGFLRLHSPKAGAFGPEDVKTADLFATMASLSLANIQFLERVTEQATHDPLTQLHSHRAFQDRLQEELLRAGRSQTPLSLIFCDIDHFKSYNDRYGHQAGDHLLRTMAAILASFARPVDCAARYGGEEFALIVPNFVRSEAVELANRIRVRVASEPFVFQGQKTSVTLSLGVASFPQDATTASQIVRAADERLYKAKEGGRNQVVG